MSSVPTLTGGFVFVCLAISGCTLQGAFVEDTRLTILNPEDRAEVRLPLTLDWEVSEFEIAPPGPGESDDRGFFAIFVDRAPMPPGEDLESLAESDLECRRDPQCPDRDWFARHGVFYTTDTTFQIETLSDTRPIERPEAVDRHEITIVLVTGRGERIGETAFSVEFDVVRETPP
ncbi:MAG: hypothetical protein ABR505_12565 [Actinomycetota bacterium]